MSMDTTRGAKITWFVLGLVGCTIAALVLLRFTLLKPSNGLSKKVIHSVNYPLYYPSSLPTGYNLDKDSVKTDRGIVFYSLSSGSQKISLSEQAAPVTPPDFDAIQRGNTSFKKLSVLGGQAIYGVYQKVPAAILLTNTTLININGSKNMPLDTIGQLAKSMSPLGQ